MSDIVKVRVLDNVSGATVEQVDKLTYLMSVATAATNTAEEAKTAIENKISAGLADIDDAISELPQSYADFSADVGNLKSDIVTHKDHIKSLEQNPIGMSSSAVNLLFTILKSCATYTTQTANINALEALLTADHDVMEWEQEDTPATPDEPSTPTAQPVSTAFANKTVSVGNVSSVTGVTQDNKTVVVTIEEVMQ